MKKVQIWIQQGIPFDPNKVSEIERVCDDYEEKELKAYKTLGVYFDEHLTFARHVETLMAKLSRAIYMLSRVQNILPTAALKSIYYSLFHSHVLYCPTVISCTSNANIDKIIKMQKKQSESSLMPHTMPTQQLSSHITKSWHTCPSSNNQKYLSCTLIASTMHLQHLMAHGRPTQIAVATMSL
jgi:hypothetical protein